MRDVARRRTRLNETALLVADRIEQQRDDGPPDQECDLLEVDLLDAELAAERLSVATRRLVLDESPRPTTWCGRCSRGCARSAPPPPPARSPG